MEDYCTRHMPSETQTPELALATVGRVWLHIVFTSL